MRGPINSRREFLGIAGTAALGTTIVGSSSAGAVQSDGNWSAYRSGAMRTGYEPTSAGIRSDFEVEWTEPTGRAALVVTDGETVYLRGESLVGVTRDGERKWDRQAPSGRWQDVSAGDDGVVVTSNKTVSAFGADGQRRWETSVDYQNVFVTRLDDRLFVAATDSYPTEASAGTVYAIDAATGDIEYSTQVPRLGWYLSASADRVFVTQFIGDGGQPGVRALDPATGETDWTWQTGNEPTLLLPPAIGHGQCYVTNQGSLVALDAATGNEVWNEQYGQRVAPPVLTPNMLYTVVDQQLLALDPATGEPRWQQETGGRLAIGVGETLYTTGEEGLFAHDRATGEIVGEFLETGAQGVVPVGDRLLLSADERVFALGSAAGGTGGSDTTADHEISVGPGGELVFDPEELRIDRGDTVRWVWESDNHLIQSKEIPAASDWTGNENVEDAGFVYEHTFDIEGVYEYACAPHEAIGMVGTLVVGNADGTDGDESGAGGESGSGSDETSPDGNSGTSDDDSLLGGDDETDSGPSDESPEDETPTDDQSDNETALLPGGENGSQSSGADELPGPGILGALGGLGGTAGWLARKSERDEDAEE
ncbi:Plastocyanin [Natronoarchaeum philippinense]|uniref:Plastocyanin n=1 Tax=Natronoarchaeum philippinense TaxID=558529 RepID=A0A285NBV9_NATPI|nr:PQQ-binding-like beta-propeller repeat protein [Natronoarchaeum philippinense]SNZ06403.1 Plastocyanin [Natronoarchaeum philippinense]